MAAVLLTGSSGIWERLPMHWKALALIVTILGVGFSGGVVLAGQLQIPERVTSLENEHGSMKLEHDSMKVSINVLSNGNELDRCLLKRVICRLDGNSANSCDLKYAVRRGVCTD